MNKDVIKSIIAEYKMSFQQMDTDERYKWVAIKCFQDNWNPDAENFKEMLKAATAKAKNLLDSQGVFPRGMILEYAENFPEETRQWFIALFDETQPLLERIQKFIETAQVLNNKFYDGQAGKKTHQDLHAISVYLSFRYPEKYYFYKRTMFVSFAKQIGFEDIPKQGKIENLPAYFKMAEEIRQIIIQDNELKQLNYSRLDDSCYKDLNCTALTQDIILFAQKNSSVEAAAGAVIKEEKKKDQEKETEKNMENNKSVEFSLNTIFYGPPGTGKTYKLLEEIAKKYFYEQVRQLTEEERNAKFVENLNWWEVIALCLLDNGNSSKVGDIIKHPLIEAHLKNSNTKKPRSAIWGQLQIHTKEDCPDVKYSLAKRAEPKVFFKKPDSTWVVDRDLLEEICPDLLKKLEEYRTPVGTGEIIRYQFITFHQSYSYENFVEGICAETDDDGNIHYEVKPGIFWTFCQKAKKDPEHNYAIFIDEINRANVSGVFGELITLIESDKRAKLSTTLPYSRTDFSVPKNLYIFGSMNTADRSIDALDSALRRRFSFVEMPPDPKLLSKEEFKPKHISVDLCALLKSINRRVEFLLDRDHKIGHSYFMKIRAETKDKELAKLRNSFKNKIIPLLEDYFYGNLEKVQMILGNKFIIPAEDHELTSDCLMCGGDSVEFPDKVSLKVAEISELTEQDFCELIR